MKRTLIVCTIAGGLVLGCDHQEKKSEANAHWNQARAAVLASLAKNQLEAGDFDKSRQSITQALAMSPNDANLHTLAGKLDIESGQLEQAEAELKMAGSLDAKNGEIDYLKGVVYQRWQKPAEALDAYTAASTKNANELAYLLARAEMLVALSRNDDAIAALRAGENKFEHDAVLHHTIGQLQSTQHDLNGAVEELRQANRLDPDDASIQEDLALALYGAGDYRAAADWLTRLVQTSAAKRADLWLALGECQMQQGLVRQARESFDTAAQLDDNSAPTQLALGKASMALGDGRRAELVIRKGIALAPANPEGHLLLGFLQLRQAKLNDARGEFQKASQLDKADALSICMIGYTFEKAGQSNQAMPYYAAALRLNPKDELASKLLAGVDMSH